MGIRGVQLRRLIGPVRGRCEKPLRLRSRVPYEGEGEGLHLPPVPEALNRQGARTPRTLVESPTPRFTPPMGLEKRQMLASPFASERYNAPHATDTLEHNCARLAVTHRG